MNDGHFFVPAVLFYVLSLSRYLSLLSLLQELEMEVGECNTTMPLTADASPFQLPK